MTFLHLCLLSVVQLAFATFHPSFLIKQVYEGMPLGPVGPASPHHFPLSPSSASFIYRKNYSPTLSRINTHIRGVTHQLTTPEAVPQSTKVYPAQLPIQVPYLKRLTPTLDNLRPRPNNPDPAVDPASLPGTNPGAAALDPTKLPVDPEPVGAATRTDYPGPSLDLPPLDPTTLEINSGPNPSVPFDPTTLPINTGSNLPKPVLPATLPIPVHSGPIGSSPVRIVECQTPPLVCQEGKYRTADGSCNNLHGHPLWGAAGRPQTRLLPPTYSDGKDQPRKFDIHGRPLPSPRAISQKLHTGDSPAKESSLLTHFFTVWGQFLDHDITHTPVAKDLDGSNLDCCNKPRIYPYRDVYWIPQTSHLVVRRPATNPNCFPISVNPITDRFFRTGCMNFVRSKSFAPSSSCNSATREQGNTVTSYVDASQVYGSTPGNLLHLRTRQGGQLKSSSHDMLPHNSTTMCTRRPNSADYCFGSGDPRVNEHPMLSTLHTVFHRLHNQLALSLAHVNPHWNDETLFQEARKLLGGIMQHVTYAEYLPLVLGRRAMDRYRLSIDGPQGHSYDPTLNPDIFNSFSTAAFRYGHSMVNTRNGYGYQMVNLRDMFFKPHFVQRDNGMGLNLVLNGLLRVHAQSSDRHMSKDLTDHLFQGKTSGGLDLASLNIQRGRDHGLPSYDEFRKLCGLPSLREVMQIGKFRGVPFLSVYRNLEDVDLFTGGLSEDPEEGGVVGPTFTCLIARQFQHIKAGDRFWFENTGHRGAFTPEQIAMIKTIKMSHILCATSDLKAVQSNPFVEASHSNRVQDCAAVGQIDVSAWKETV